MTIQAGNLEGGKFAGLSLRAWANVICAGYPTSATVAKSANITSITTPALAGKHSIVFTSPMTNTNYMVNVQCTAIATVVGAVSNKTVNGCNVQLSNECVGQNVQFEVYE